MNKKARALPASTNNLRRWWGSTRDQPLPLFCPSRPIVSVRAADRSWTVNTHHAEQLRFLRIKTMHLFFYFQQERDVHNEQTDTRRRLSDTQRSPKPRGCLSVITKVSFIHSFIYIHVIIFNVSMFVMRRIFCQQKTFTKKTSISPSVAEKTLTGNICRHSSCVQASKPPASHCASHCAGHCAGHCKSHCKSHCAILEVQRWKSSPKLQKLQTSETGN